jgi:hypothetical protein
LKIPGGDNLFADSTNASSYDVLHGVLTSSQATANLPSTGGNYAVARAGPPDAHESTERADLSHQDRSRRPRGSRTRPGLLAARLGRNESFRTDPNLSFNGVLLPTAQSLEFILADSVADLTGLDQDQMQAITKQVILLMRGVPS